MTAGASIAMVLIRVPRGAPAPGAEVFRNALDQDRSRLGQAPPNAAVETEVSGPYAIELDGQEIDEYVAWDH